MIRFPFGRVSTATLLGLLLAHSAIAAGLEVVEPYARAVPPGQPNSAVFMTLKNSAAEGASVVSASSPVAEVVELHEHVNKDGMMQMRQVAKIDVPGSGETVLQPGGLHVMLINLKQGLAPGEDVPVTLVLDNDETIELVAPVKKIEMTLKKGMDHGKMGMKPEAMPKTMH